MNRDFPGPWKTGSTQKCGTEYRNQQPITSDGGDRYDESTTKNLSNSGREDDGEGKEEEEEEKLSEDDITTDECEKEDSSEEEGA